MTANSTRPARIWESAWARYGLSVAAIVLSGLVRYALEPWLHGRSPFVTMLPGIAVAAWLGGIYTGLAATAAVALFGSALMAPRFAWADHSIDNWASTISFVVSAGITIVLTHLIEQARVRARSEALRRQQSEERLAVTLQSIGDGVMATDERGHVTTLNPVAEALCGWTVDEARAAKAEDVFHIVNEETRERVASPVERVLREGIVVGLANHTLLIARDGTERPIEDSGAPIRDRTGAMIGTVLVFRDATERRKAEAELQHLGAVIGSTDDAFVTVTPQGMIAAWNDGATRLYGYTREEVIGKPFTTVFAPGTEHVWPDLQRRINAGERIQHFLTQRRHRDGHLIDVSVGVTALRDANGKVTAISSIARDISATLRAQRQVERHEELLATTLRSIGDAVVTTDAEGRVSFMNPAAETLTGWQLSKAVGADAARVIRLVDSVSGEALPDPTAAAPGAADASGTAERAAVMHTDGTRVAVEVSATPIRGSRGATTGTVIVLRDVTQRRRAEAERAELTAQLQEQARLLDMAQVVIRDAEDRIVMWNHGAEHLYQFTPEEAIGANAHTMLKTSVPGGTSAIRDALMSTGVWDGEVEQIRKDGTAVVVVSHQVLFRDVFGLPHAILEVNNDVTQQRGAEDALRSERAAVEELNERLRRAMSETHHRVKNSLQVIAALVDMQLMKDEKLVSVAELQRIGQHIRSLAAVHELLTQEAKEHGQADALNTSEVMDRLHPLLQGLVGQRVLSTDVHHFRLPIRQGTAVAVLINELVANAVKHGEGNINLTLTCSGDLGRLEVTDCGPGFPAGFTPRDCANTGLEIIESVGRWDLQGSVEYNNRPEGGAQVVVTFPAHHTERNSHCQP